MKIHNTRLEAKVAARNRVNALALEKLPAILAALAPFVGKKVQDASGQIADRIQKALPELENTLTTYQGYYCTRRYSIHVYFRVLEKSKGHYSDSTLAAYADKDVTLGELALYSGALVKLADGHAFRTDYTVGEIERLRKKVTAARDAMHDAEFKLAGFGEHDNS